MTNGDETAEPGIVRADEIERDDHHAGWNQALKRALENVPDTWHGEELNVRYAVVTTKNPGSVHEYKVYLGPR